MRRPLAHIIISVLALLLLFNVLHGTNTREVLFEEEKTTWEETDSSQFLPPSSNNHNNHNNNNSMTSNFHGSQRPIILGSGQGTTGTTTLFTVLCAMGIPGLHLTVACPHNRHNKHSNSTLWQAHVELREEASRLFVNCYRRRDHGKDDGKIKAACDQKKTRADLTKIYRLMDKVLEFDEVDAYLDSPYSYFPSYMQKAAERIRGVPPIILLTERESTQWVQRRVADHPGVAACRPHNRTKSLYLDVETCFGASERLQHANHNDPETTTTTVELVGLANFKPTATRNDYNDPADLAEALDRFQIEQRAHATFRINLFEQHPKLSNDELQALLYQKVPQLSRYWNGTHKRKL